MKHGQESGLGFQEMNDAIRFFEAATPFVAVLGIFVALVIIFLLLRPRPRDAVALPPTDDRHEKIKELVEKIMKTLL
jgi:hypothetical protein